MNKILLSLLVIISTRLLYAGNNINSQIPTQTTFIAANEKGNLDKFETSLRAPYLINGIPRQRLTIYQVMKNLHIPGVSILAIHNGKISWIKSYGYKDNKTKSSLKTNDLLQAGSISKAIAALGTLELVNNNKLNLDKNINDYLIGWKVPSNKYTKKQYVTTRMLLSHTAGTNVHGFPGIPITKSQNKFPNIIDVLNGQKPLITTEAVNVISIPGTEFSYSGGGTSILQLAEQDITKESFAEWMKNQVLYPLGMKQSTYQQPLPNSYNLVASSAHDINGTPYKSKYNNYPELAAAGLWTNPTDLSKAILALIKTYYNESNVLGINHNLAKQLFIPQPNSTFGLGLMLNKQNNVLMFGHDGGNDGFQSTMLAFVSPNQQKPELKDGLIIMTNSDHGMILNQMLMNSFNDVYKVGYIPAIIVNQIPLTQNIWKYKVSFILDKNDFPHNVYLKNNKIFLDWGHGAPPQQLYQISKNHFISTNGSNLFYSWAKNKLSLSYQFLDNKPIQVNIIK